MKAYWVSDVNGDSESQAIVFADSASKAKTMWEDAGQYDFTELRAIRKPSLDQYAELGYVPKQALLEDGWWFECYEPKCSQHLTLNGGPVVVNEQVYCQEHAPKEASTNV